MTDTLTFRQVETIADINEADWQRLQTHGNPFLDWRFLAELEHCVDLDYHGWLPAHVVAYNEQKLVAAIPLYSKLNSHGEFVFDWMIADAYHQAAIPYYPKYVSAIPFTPVIGSRILFADEVNDTAGVAGSLVDYVCKCSTEQQLSSINFLFVDNSTIRPLNQQQFIPRHTWQYHWHNDQFADFDAFLATLSSKRRKQIKRERRSIVDQNIRIDVLHGDEIQEHHWDTFYRFYCSTFARKWGEPRFTRKFFLRLTEAMPSAIVLFLASVDGTEVAGSFTLKSDKTLYGRHWGCDRWLNNLHFEMCYYQTIDYCIQHGLTTLDAGVQGEHKLLRGFVPVRATSMHYFHRPEFHDAINKYFRQESQQVDHQLSVLRQHNAYNSQTARKFSL